MKNVKIVYKAPSELVPYENNPRNNGPAVDTVIASIKEFGFKNPIIIDSDNVIITGHTRLLAAESMGLDKVPCIVADDLTEEQAKAFRLVDNRSSELSEWDWAVLGDELEWLDDADFDMFEFGFDDIDIKRANLAKGIRVSDTQDDDEDDEEFKEYDEDIETGEHKCPKCGFEW